jgi:hypothetical protein
METSARVFLSQPACIKYVTIVQNKHFAETNL